MKKLETVDLDFLLSYTYNVLMSKHNKTYRFRMQPTKDQEHALNFTAGARRWVWNWALERRLEHYKEFGKVLSCNVLTAELAALKTQTKTAWLKDINSHALQQAIFDLDQAFIDFFEKRAGFPRFKCRKQDGATFHVRQRVQLVDGRVYAPKLGLVRIHQSQDISLTTKGATFKRNARGHWFVTLIAEFEMPDIALPPPDLAKVVGIDLGLIDFATLSDGSDPIPAPKFYRKGEKKQRKAQQVFSRRKKGSKRKAKAARRVVVIQAKVAAQRKDFLHKLTTRLVRQYDGLCIEDLCVRSLARTKLAKSIHDASWGEFCRQLTYKAEWNRKHLVVIDRYFPSTKMCNACGAINDTLTRSDREWDCGCGVHHDRDLNAAINIRNEGLRILAEGHSDSQNAQRRPVRLPTGSKVG